MKHLLIKLFIKNYNDVNDLNVRKKYGILASIFGIITNIFICILKITIGLIFNMISFIGDGINNLSDAFSNIVSLISFKLSSKPADKDHPFGHARIEYIASFIIALFIDFFAIELLIESFEKIFSSSDINNDFSFFIISFVILFISILIKAYQCYFNYSIGKKINSTTLKYTAIDSRNDVITTFVILIGLCISYFAKINLDGYLGVLLALFILFSSIKGVVELTNKLIGAKPDQIIVDKFISKIKSYDGVLGIHDLQMHCYGLNYIFATCHVEIDSKIDILVSHELIDTIENDIFNSMKIHTVLHMDPLVLNDEELEKAKLILKEVFKDFPFNLHMHDVRIVKGPTFTNVIFDLVIPEKMPILEEELIKQISDKVKNKCPYYNLVIKIDYDFEDLTGI